MPDKTRHHAICASTILIALIFALTLFSASIMRAQDSAAAKTTFHSKCEMCHGPDGGGSTVGKSMNIPDLRSPAVQKLPDAELAQIISNGKAGMPPFKSSLSENQIHALVKYIHTLHQKK